jgi:hypothetical protein
VVGRMPAIPEMTGQSDAAAEVRTDLDRLSPRRWRATTAAAAGCSCEVVEGCASVNQVVGLESHHSSGRLVMPTGLPQRHASSR